MGYTRGQPDWSGSGARTFTGAGGSDLENAARRNWPLAQSITGEVFFYDDFEASVLHWQQVASDDGIAATLVSSRANAGSQSVYIHAPSGDGEYGYIGRGMVLPTSPTLGMSAFITPDTSLGRIEFLITATHNGRQTSFELYYTLETGAIQVHIPSGFITVGSIPTLYSFTDQWAWFQLVIDLDNLVYRSVTVGAERIELDQLPYQNVASASPENVAVYITYTNTAALVRGMYVDDVVITRNQK